MPAKQGYGHEAVTGVHASDSPATAKMLADILRVSQPAQLPVAGVPLPGHKPSAPVVAPTATVEQPATGIPLPPNKPAQVQQPAQVQSSDVSYELGHPNVVQDTQEQPQQVPAQHEQQPEALPVQRTFQGVTDVLYAMPEEMRRQASSLVEQQLINEGNKQLASQVAAEFGNTPVIPQAPRGPDANMDPTYSIATSLMEMDAHQQAETLSDMEQTFGPEFVSQVRNHLMQTPHLPQHKPVGPNWFERQLNKVM